MGPPVELGEAGFYWVLDGSYNPRDLRVISTIGACRPPSANHHQRAQIGDSYSYTGARVISDSYTNCMYELEAANAASTIPVCGTRCNALRRVEVCRT